MKFNRFALALITATMAALLAGCGALGSAPPAAPVSMAFAPSFMPPAAMNINSKVSIAATISNDPNNLGVTWKATCSGERCGSFSATSTASGVSTQFTAPPAIPSGNTVTVTATSVADSSKSLSANITIGQDVTTLSDGTYIYNLSGTDFTNDSGASNYYVVGAITVAGGAIVGGEQDFVDDNGALNDLVNSSTSSITSTADGNLQIVLDTQDPYIGVSGVETLSASLVTSKRALVGEYDSSAAGTGTLDVQTTQAAPSGGYAFLAQGTVSGIDLLALGGILNVDGSGSISGEGSVFDFNEAFGQGLMRNQRLSASSVLGPGGTVAPDSFGRVTFTLNPTNANIGPILLVGYIVNPSVIQLVETTDTLGGAMGGTAFSQGGNTGGFSNSSLSGSSYVAAANGFDSNGPLQLAGVLAFSSTDKSVSGNTTFNDIANQLSGNISAGTYVVDATGRATLTGLNGATFNNATLQLYLDGNGNALILSMNTSDVTAGYAFQQSPGAIFSGTYAVDAGGTSQVTSSIPVSYVPWSASGQITDSTGNITGFTDFNPLTGSLTAGVNLDGTATGSGEILTGSLAGLGIASSTTPDSFTYYIIDGIRVFGIETDATQLGPVYFEQAPPSK